MEFRQIGRTAHARARDLLAAPHLVAARHLQLTGMAVDGDQAVLVTHQNRVAELLQPVAGIDHDAVFGRLDRRAFRHGNINAVIRLGAGPIASIAGDDPAAHRPAHALHAGRLGRDGRALGDGFGDRLIRRTAGGLVRFGRRIGSHRAFRCIGSAFCTRAGGLDRIDGVVRPDDRLTGCGNAQFLSDAQMAVAQAVGLLERSGGGAALTRDTVERIAGHDRVKPVLGRGRRGGVAGLGGGHALPRLRRLRQDRHVAVRRAARQRYLVGRHVVARAARGFCLHHVGIGVGRGNRRLARIDIGRDHHLLARRQVAGRLHVVDLHDRLDRHAEATREIVERFALADRHLGAAGPRPALALCLRADRRRGGRGELTRRSRRRHGLGCDRCRRRRLDRPRRHGLTDGRRQRLALDAASPEFGVFDGATIDRGGIGLVDPGRPGPYVAGKGLIDRIAENGALIGRGGGKYLFIEAHRARAASGQKTAGGQNGRHAGEIAPGYAQDFDTHRNTREHRLRNVTHPKLKRVNLTAALRWRGRRHDFTK